MTRFGRERPRELSARTADRFALYEQSVQEPEAEIRFIDRIYWREHGRHPESLREDFCGTALLCARWVQSRRTRTAIGLDVHAPTLAYGRRRHIAPLGDAGRRVQLLERNVLQPGKERVDVVVAFNFSYCVLKERREMLCYFENVRQALRAGGIFVLDIYGGPDAQTELVEKRRVKGFTYVWDQRPYEALSSHAKRYIHFRFRDGSELKRAFAYDWRIWCLPEIRDLLREARFSRVEVYWEGADPKGEGNGIFRKVQRADNEQAWIAYVLAWR